MGVKSEITIKEANRLFPSYCFTKLLPTSSGIIDTTYIISTKNESYILKKYERDVSTKIESDIRLLTLLKEHGLNTPSFIDSKDEWYLYEKLKGEQPKSTQTFHIQELARFLAKFHNITAGMACRSTLIEKDEIQQMLKYTKNNFFAYYKKLEFLNGYQSKNEALIHGDIFKDNTVFENNKIGVFDFIDSTCGSFSLDAAVALVGFDIDVNNNYFINLFLKTYNQKAPKKIDKCLLMDSMVAASSFYALKRVNNYKKTSKAKELIRWI